MTTGVRAGHSDLRKIQRKFKKGYHLASSGSGGHYIVMGPDGPVRRNDGSGRHLGMPSSPRASSIWYHIQRLRDHGVLEEQGPRLLHRGEGLVRDDLEGLETIRPEANNDATKQLLEDLVAVKIHKPRNLKEYAELTDVLSHVSGEPPSETHNSLMRLYNGMTLTETEREPIVQLLGILETEEDPIRLRFSLLRQARGLPPHEEDEVAEEPIQEENVSTPQEMFARAASSGFGVEQLVGNFISDLREQVTQKMDEINKIEDLINSLEEQYPSIKFEASHEAEVTGRTMQQHPISPPTPPVERTGTRGENGGGTRARSTRTVRVSPEEDESSDRPGRGFRKGSLDGEKVFQMIAQGGEWTIQELAEGLGSTDSVITNRVRTLVDNGRVVVVTPAKMGKGGKKPATYGDANIYQK